MRGGVLLEGASRQKRCMRAWAWRVQSLERNGSDSWSNLFCIDIGRGQNLCSCFGRSSIAVRHDWSSYRFILNLLSAAGWKR
jgi:hypothetical protein